MASLWRRVTSGDFLLTDEELGKKDDDHGKLESGVARRRRSGGAAAWTPARTVVPLGRRRRRRGFRLIVVVVASVVVLGLLYFVSFFHGWSSGADWSGYASRYKASELLHRPFPGSSRGEPPSRPNVGGQVPLRGEDQHTDDPPSQEDEDAEAIGTAGEEEDKGGEEEEVGGRISGSAGERSNNGPFKFLELGESLRSIEATRGKSSYNQNVLFAAMSLKSASALLPLACQMGRELRNYVHFALMSRDDMLLEDLKSINGIDEGCHIIFHDARPDHAWESTDLRARLAAERVLYHVQYYMHPQAIIIDGSNTEDPFFLRAMRNPSAVGALNVIELPENGARWLEWITRLDAASLYMWNKVNLEILIHAPPTGSGSLIRLLKSLSRADLWPFGIPRLTIELPARLERATDSFLQTFSWPPRGTHNPSRVQMLSLRRRVSRDTMDEERSAVRFLESYWPVDALHSHVLVLSPQTELTRDFLHYLKFVLLEYRYSGTAVRQHWDKRLLGISLAAPTTYLNGTEFTPPAPLDETQPDGTSFLWQAPSSDAVLISGAKWTELHNFISRSLEAGNEDHDSVSDKVVSTKYPAWLEYLARLCRLRGYLTLYPSRDTASTIATVHADLAQRPEEYGDEQLGGDEEEMKRRTESRNGEVTIGGASMLDMLNTLPNRGDLPAFRDMPLLGWEGNEVPLREMDGRARAYAMEFRRTVGGCSAEEVEALEMNPSATDLFCHV